MTMKLKTLITASIFALPTFVSADGIPATCCPTACKTVEGSVEMGANNATATLTFANARTRTLPIAQDLFTGKSSSQNFQVCIQYTEFGDEEIKCILSPSMM